MTASVLHFSDRTALSAVFDRIEMMERRLEDLVRNQLPNEDVRLTAKAAADMFGIDKNVIGDWPVFVEPDVPGGRKWTTPRLMRAYIRSKTDPIIGGFG